MCRFVIFGLKIPSSKMLITFKLIFRFSTLISLFRAGKIIASWMILKERKERGKNSLILFFSFTHKDIKSLFLDQSVQFRRHHRNAMGEKNVSNIPRKSRNSGKEVKSWNIIPETGRIWIIGLMDGERFRKNSDYKKRNTKK